MARKTEGQKAAEAAQKASTDHLGDLGTGDGFIGQKVDPKPNSAHSLESGPDGVPPLEGQRDGMAAATRIGEALEPHAQADGGDEGGESA